MAKEDHPYFLSYVNIRKLPLPKGTLRDDNVGY